MDFKGYLMKWGNILYISVDTASHPVGALSVGMYVVGWPHSCVQSTHTWGPGRLLLSLLSAAEVKAGVATSVHGAFPCFMMEQSHSSTSSFPSHIK